MKISIIGYGHVGRSMHKEFKDAYIFDEPQGIGTREEVNKSDVAFIAVPTPMSDDGSCDTSVVEYILSWIEADVIVLRSTVYVGFTEWASQKFNKRIVFHPEYYGETVSHPFSSPDSKQWLVFGGESEDVSVVINAYKRIKNSNISIYQGPSKEAELAKYMENIYFAAKVTFVNEMKDIADSMGVNFDITREFWLADPRVTKYHTFVYDDNRGFAGKCLPKDLASLVYQTDKLGVNNSMIKNLQEKNIYFQSKNEPNSQNLYNEKVNFE